MDTNTLTHLPVQSGHTYRNPLPLTAGTPDGKLTAEVHPDPYVLKYNGTYYAYATGEQGVSVLRSADMAHWTHLGYAFAREGYKGYWAPAVVYENGVFYLYVSAMPEGEDDVHTERLMVATSTVPEGTFRYEKTLYDTFSLDAHVVKDEHGDYYLFYSNNEYAGVDGERPGTVILVDRLVDMLTPEGKPQLVVAPTIDEEIYEENRFGDGRDWHTIEGAFYLRRGSKHYVMYSGNAYVRPNYFLGYSAAEAQEGRKLTELEWRKYPADDRFEPLLCKNEGVEGVGHNSVVRALNNVDSWVYYHGRNAEDELDFGREQRTMRMDPLLWCGDEMWIPGPSYKEQDMPALPALRDLFGGLLSPQWQTVAGDWQSGEGEVHQTERSGETTLVTKCSFGSLVLEASLKWHHDHRGGRYGLYPYYADARNFVICLLDVGQRTIEAYALRHGVKQAAVKAKLPSDFNFKVYHLLRIEKTGSDCVILLDDVQVLKGSFPMARGHIGFATQFTSASFAGVEVTDHLALSEGVESGFAGYVQLLAGSGQCEVSGGELLCRSTKGRSAWRLEAPSPETEKAYRFSVDLKLSGEASSAGIYAVHQSAEDAVEILLDRKRVSVSVTKIEAGVSRTLSEAALPDGFDWSRPHAIEAVFRDGVLFARLDRMRLFEGSVPLHSGTPGFICRGSASFRHVQMTGLAVQD